MFFCPNRESIFISINSLTHDIIYESFSVPDGPDDDVDAPPEAPPVNDAEPEDD